MTHYHSSPPREAAGDGRATMGTCQHQFSPDEDYSRLVCSKCGAWEWLPESDFDDEDDYCDTCGGEGVVITCVDDLCVGAGECMHGDGEEPCPDCHGGY